LAGAAVLLDEGKTTLIGRPGEPDDELWFGPRPGLAQLGAELGFDGVLPLDRAADRLAPLAPRLATLPTEDARTAAWQSELVGRAIAASSGATLTDARDGALADAIIALRLRHDGPAIAQLRAAAALTAEALLAGMRATGAAGSEREVLAAIIACLRRHGLGDSFGPIVTVHGEVLHSEDHSGPLSAGELLLADVGGETPEGWAGDITRTWPVSGRFSPSQRAVYEVVLAAQRAAIGSVRPGVRYRDVHEIAKRRIVEGMRELGVLRGETDGLLERGAAALFFPHGIGHLLGLDVHDMEDLGDRAGYAPGRTRSARFGDAYLRLDRDLEPGMAVTIEPGFYQVPAILGSAELNGPLGHDLVRSELAKLADVRGIRIEDDVLVTETGHEVLTGGVPKDVAVIEAVLGGAR
jgi:Xaa-Pro aminopeptidase